MEDLERESSDRRHRYSLVMPEKDFEAVQEAAADMGVTAVNFIRRSIVLGLLVEKSLGSGGKLIRREANGREVELIII